jgi:cobalt/nickel transport system ATP-binding protein
VLLTTQNKILEARDVRYSYADGPQALSEMSVAIEQGKKVALVGPNGAGKSTLLLMFNGILRPGSGQIFFKGRPLKYDAASLREIRRKVGLVFQNPDDQIFAPTVHQDVAFGPANLGYPKEKVDRYVKYALEYVGLSGYDRRPPHHLSGGEKKRVAIAGVLAMEPEVMILDEPTSNLDPASAEEMMEMLDELSSGGKTLIISTHDVELAYRWSDDVVLMEHGGLIHRGTVQEVFGDAELLKRARMKMPIVMAIYRELLGRGLIDDLRVPRSVLEITDILEKKARGKVSCQSLGKVFICNSETTDPKDIKSFISTGAASFCGAMGTSAKVVADREKIGLDFTYGVIDKCILKALAGQSSLIMTSGGMVDHARRRIGAYSLECGINIEALQLPEPLHK